MSMTLEEAIKALRLERGIEINGNAVRVAEFLQGLDVAISALRPVSRERIAKMPRCEHCKDGKSFDGQVVIMGNKGMFPLNFCPRCGSPLTDEAVEIRLKELEALKDV